MSKDGRSQNMDKVNDALSNPLYAVDHAKAHPSAAADTVLATAVRRALRVGVELYVVDRIAGFTGPIEILDTLSDYVSAAQARNAALAVEGPVSLRALEGGSMSAYEQVAWEWKNRDRLAAILAARAVISGLWGRPTPAPVAEAHVPAVVAEIRAERQANARAAAVYNAKHPMPVEEEDISGWLTMDQIAERYGLSPRTIETYTRRLSAEDSRDVPDQTGEYVYGTFGGVLDVETYWDKTPGAKNFLWWRDPANRDGNMRMPEASRSSGSSRFREDWFIPGHFDSEGNPEGLLVDSGKMKDVDSGLSVQCPRRRVFRPEAVDEVMRLRRKRGRPRGS